MVGGRPTTRRSLSTRSPRATGSPDSRAVAPREALGEGVALAPPHPPADLDAGLLGPSSLTWQVDREAFLLLGAGPRALLLQLAHPAVAAGVADHSTFRADPWARLAATLGSYLRIVYGSRGVARAEAARLRRRHAGLRGVMEDGRAYDALDPAASLWVHATLVDSTIAVADAWLGPLDGEARRRLYAESLPIAALFGLEGRVPPDLASFRAYVDSMLGPDGPAHPGPVARDLAAAVLRPPSEPPLRAMAAALPPRLSAPALAALDRLPVLPTAATSWLLLPSVGLLPPTVRAAYGLPWGPVEQAIARWLVLGWRTWNAALPRTWRAMPHALRAERRLGLSPRG